MAMRRNLDEGENELRELSEKKAQKETEWASSRNSASSADAQVHMQTLSMISQQITEKRAFNKELQDKSSCLEDQIQAQRVRLHDPTAPLAPCVPSLPRADSSCEEDKAVDTATGGNEARLDALKAFLEAAGPDADVIIAKPALRAAFASRPLSLSAGAVNDLGPQDRSRAISLFAAWSAVASEAPHALRMSDIGLQNEDLQELHNTLDTCGAQFEEVEMTRCLLGATRVTSGGSSASNSKVASSGLSSALFRGLVTQPLRHLSIGYNALGCPGASALLEAAGAWTSTLEHLSLEMNGLGDAGCHQVVRALERGLWPALCSLELGWNELTAECANGLAQLINGGSGVLQRIALGGNKLGCEGASVLVQAALIQPAQRALELDLSMNHVGPAPLKPLVAWAEDERSAGTSVAVSICLEWNVVDDAGTVRRLARAIGRAGITSDTGAPLLKLGNNDELAELSAEDILHESRGLVSC